MSMQLLLGIAIACASQLGEKSPPADDNSIRRVYARLLDPREHPDYRRRHVQPPTWDTFGNETQFATLRGFNVQDKKITGFREALDLYTRRHDLGNVIWPSYPILFAENLDELAGEIRKRDLFLFDIWGYVPGSGPGGYWTQFTPPDGVFELLESTLGDHWLGMDVGEQDGRYIGGYASQMFPVSGDRVEQYLNFQRHFQRLCDELGNKMSTLVSLNFGHYFLKEGIYTTIGAETAQALPNGQVYYAFIRGAGKQYGVPWFGNASVWNRWGWKVYGQVTPPDHGPQPGPTKGTSLNLLKRLLYHHILYNCVVVGFESSWFDGESLTPVGRIQKAAQQWVRNTGSPGVMVAPVAVMTDFFAGWSFPRHLYTGNVYRVWGNLPYGPGDYLTNGVLDMLYPGYQDASYFHDESGFITATPYGDIADCLLSDAEPWLLARYPVVIVATELVPGIEIRDKLEAYAREGGHLVITAGNVVKFDGGIAGVTVAGEPRRTKVLPDEDPGVLYPLSCPSNAQVLVARGDLPAVVDVPYGAGRVTVLASSFGLPAEAQPADLVNEVDRSLANPYPLLPWVREALDKILRQQMLFEAGEGLSLVTCRKGPGEYTLGIANNALQPRSFEIVSHCGPLQSVVELPLDQSEKGAIGYLPEGFEDASIGSSGDGVIAGGDVRIFSVRVQEQGEQEIAHEVPGPRVTGRVLPLGSPRPIKEQILERPTFFEHFDSVIVDWRYVQDRDQKALTRESGWLARQGLRIYVDLTSGINLFPDLRLVANDSDEYTDSMATVSGVLEKMPLLGARDLVLSLHRVPENNISREDTWVSFETTLREISAQAANREITVHLRLGTKEQADRSKVIELFDRVDAPNLRIAPSAALLVHAKVAPADAVALLEGKVGLWFVSAPEYDQAGTLWTLNGHIAGRENSLAPYLAHNADAPLVLDAVYADQDAEYLDARALARIVDGKNSSEKE